MNKKNAFKVEFERNGMACTLETEHIGTHESGWTIKGQIVEDYFVWVNEFTASHPLYGKVCGDFETVVYASSEEAYKHFLKNHPPSTWDYQDI